MLAESRAAAGEEKRGAFWNRTGPWEFGAEMDVVEAPDIRGRSFASASPTVDQLLFWPVTGGPAAPACRS